MTITELENTANSLFTKEGLSCSESVLLAMARYWGIESPLIPRIATPFRGGICGTQQICGAVSGGLMAIGLRLGRDSGADAAKECGEKGKAFMAWVKSRNGALSCREITDTDFSDDEQHKIFAETKRHTICEPLVVACCRWLAENIK